MDVGQFLGMGGYAAYVWPSYGLALLILLANLFSAHRRQRDVLRQLAALERHRADPS